MLGFCLAVMDARTAVFLKKPKERSTTVEKVLRSHQPGSVKTTDYGHPMKYFFIKIPKPLSLDRQFGKIDFGAFGVK